MGASLRRLEGGGGDADFSCDRLREGGARPGDSEFTMLPVAVREKAVAKEWV